MGYSFGPIRDCLRGSGFSQPLGTVSEMLIALLANSQLKRTSASLCSSLPLAVVRSTDMDGDPRECIPTIIGGGKVLLYSRIDDRHRASQQVEAEPYGIAICQEKDGRGVLLFTCEDDWMPVFDSWHATTDEAKAQAASQWDGIADTWEEPPE